MTERIFISYRRDDSAGHAGRVFDRLRQDFKDSVLFMDVDAIPLGANFVKVLREEVGRCSVLLAIIGPRWLEAMDEDGARRLDNPDDFVRVEIAAALARDIPVIPILLEGARIPAATTLPADLQELSQRNGLDVRHASFHGDMDKLVRGLKGRADQTPVPPATATVPRPGARPPQSGAPTIAGSDTLLGRFIRQQRDPVPTVDDVIAARGEWVKTFNILGNLALEPSNFRHLFIRTLHGRHLNDVRAQCTAGTIVTGLNWDRSTNPFWTVVHGYGRDSDKICESLDWLTYLGPQWRPEYADLSDAVFKRLGGVPLQRFIKHS